ncbi:MAG: integrase [Sphingomonas bacterium]|uniref:Arm DNA-binding domain-containing protein n=1 Tax=Sphingomonas bacterium TaxID=1895847 RepID=UPI002606872C|nr:Arm DNA-binding domain-containing protein [Sphingomonas bacterium]MDB5705161.1 integrase [Sphingomonas bacterium]
MSLTTLAATNARPKAKPYKLTDERALHLLVMPDGGKYWRMRYRYLGKQKALALGVWPDVSLAAAREKRDATRAQIAQGLYPLAGEEAGENPRTDRLQHHLQVDRRGVVAQGRAGRSRRDHARKGAVLRPGPRTERRLCKRGRY